MKVFELKIAVPTGDDPVATLSNFLANLDSFDFEPGSYWLSLYDANRVVIGQYRYGNVFD